MPSAALRPCAEPRCPELVKSGRCAKHAKQVDRARGTATERGYDWAWAKYSKARLQRLPVCGMREDGTLDAEHSRCVQQGRTTPAEVTDHIVPMRQGGDKWSPANHLSLCAACNVWKDRY